MSENSKEVSAGKNTAPPTESSKKTVTLADLGACLPVGLSFGGSLVKDLAVRPWKTRDERELGRLKKPKMGFATYVAMIVGYMARQFGPNDWSEAIDPSDKKNRALEERRVQLARAYFGDVLYTYVYLRREALGPELRSDITCGVCGVKFAFTGDLDTLEVVTADNPEDLIWTYELRDPIKIRGKDVEKFKMAPTMWGPIEQNSTSLNEAVSKILALRASIVGLNDDATPIALTETDLDELSKRDFEKVLAAVDDHFVGPNMSLEGECEGCGAAFRSQIDWRYDSFFSISSR